MKDQFVGNIGDYIKFALLRAVMQAEPDKRLGVAWYFTHGKRNDYSRDIGYLKNPEKYACLDEDLFNLLDKIVFSKARCSVIGIERSGLLPAQTKFSRVAMEAGAGGAKSRKHWLGRLQNKLAECDIIFADPDNGLHEGWQQKSAWGKKDNRKYMLLDEAIALVKNTNAPAQYRNRMGIFSHHFTYIKHEKQIEDWRVRLAQSCASASGDAEVVALYWRAYSACAFFIVNPTREIKKAIATLQAKKIITTKGNDAIQLYGFQTDDPPAGILARTKRFWQTIRHSTNV